MVHESAESVALATHQLSEVRLYEAAVMPEPELLAFAGRTLAVFSHRSPAKTTDNEDAAAVIPWGADGGVLVVADGLGGAALGEVAASRVVRRLAETISGADPAETQLRTLILNAIEEANRDVLDLGRGAATTLAIVEIGGAKIRHYHVGDSGILACGGRGKIKVETVAHSPVGYGVESGLLDAVDALHHEDRHVVSNVLGMASMRIEIGSETQFSPRDTLVIASDGLFDNLHVPEIVEQVRKGPVERVSRELQAEAQRRMTSPTDSQPSKPDDLTFMVWR